MTLLASRPIEIYALGFRRLRVRVMAGATPQAVPTGPLAGALLQLFKMAVGAHGGRLGAGPHEVGRVVRQQSSRQILVALGAHPCDSSRAGQMALRANAVAPRRFQLRRVDDLARLARSGGYCCDVVLSRSMASLATDASFQK